MGESQLFLMKEFTLIYFIGGKIVFDDGKGEYCVRNPDYYHDFCPLKLSLKSSTLFLLNPLCASSTLFLNWHIFYISIKISLIVLY
jgi:hypothetical protein